MHLSIHLNKASLIGVIATVGVIGMAGGYLGAKIQRDLAVTKQLKQATKRLQELTRRDPSPHDANIRSAESEARRIGAFLSQVRQNFFRSSSVQPLNSVQLRAYLDTTRTALLRDAAQAGVAVPENYWFSFGAQKGQMNFSPTTLQPLASQVADIKTICEVLFESKVNSLVWLRRIPVDQQDAFGSQDYLNGRSLTNNNSILRPYEVTFDGFSSQLASVLNSFARMPESFWVSNLTVEPVEKPAAEVLPEMPRSRNRYWGREFPALSIPGISRVGPPATLPGPIVILDQQLLRFTLALQSAKAQNL